MVNFRPAVVIKFNPALTVSGSSFESSSILVLGKNWPAAKKVDVSANAAFSMAGKSDAFISQLS